MRVHLDKLDEDDRRCVYGFGTDSETVGRVALVKASGDVEVLALSADPPPPGAPFLLAQVVPRLQALHDDQTYPDTETWTA